LKDSFEEANVKDSADAKLVAKYGMEMFAHPPSMTRERMLEKVGEWDSIDQYFTRTSMDFAVGMERRTILDKRMRRLVQIGQFTCTKSFEHLEETLQAAFADGLKPREVLESLLMCQVYAGDTAVAPALNIFIKVAKEAGVLEALKHDQLPIDGNESTRILEEEKKTWKPEELNDPRRETFSQKYGWRSVSSGFRYRGQYHLNLLAHRDALDPDWCNLWETFTYQRMYCRWILDDKSRIMCTIGNTLAMGDVFQAHDHIVEGLEMGIPPREVMEIVFLVGVYFGSPKMAGCLRLFEEIVAKLGLLDEIGNPPVTQKKKVG